MPGIWTFSQRSQAITDTQSCRQGLAIDTLEAFDKLGICCLSTASDVDSYCWEDHTRVRLQYYKECEDLLLSFFPGSTSAYVFDHELRDKERLREPNQVRPSLIPGP